MKVKAGYYKWVETEIEVDDRYSILDTPNFFYRPLTSEEKELYGDMCEEVEEKLLASPNYSENCRYGDVELYSNITSTKTGETLAEL